MPIQENSFSTYYHVVSALTENTEDIHASAAGALATAQATFTVLQRIIKILLINIRLLLHVHTDSRAVYDPTNHIYSSVVLVGCHFPFDFDYDMTLATDQPNTMQINATWANLHAATT